MKTTIIEEYEHRCKTTSDINEHLPMLNKWAEWHWKIAEFGIRDGNSTIALLAGSPDQLDCYDIAQPSIWKPEVQQMVKNDLRTRWTCHQANTINMEPIPHVEMLFIDTAHNYIQLSKELALHANQVSSMIAFHDTVTYGEVGDDGCKPGLMGAIREFLASNPNWQEYANYENNNGLYAIVRS